MIYSRFCHAVPRQSLAIALLMLAIAAPTVSTARELSGQVMRALGPNSVEIKGPGNVLYSVHLRGTTIGDSGNPAAPDTEARLISELVGRYVTLTNISGSGNQLEAVVEYGHADFNQELIRDGMLELDEDTADPQLIYDYTTAEEKARIEALGIWRPMEKKPSSAPPPVGPIEPPEGGWQFRPTKP